MGQLFLIKAPNCVWLLEWQMHRAQSPTIPLVHFAFSQLLLWVEGSPVKGHIDTSRRQHQWEGAFLQAKLSIISFQSASPIMVHSVLVLLLFDWRLAPWFSEALAFFPEGDPQKQYHQTLPKVLPKLLLHLGSRHVLLQRDRVPVQWRRRFFWICPFPNVIEGLTVDDQTLWYPLMEYIQEHSKYWISKLCWP